MRLRCLERNENLYSSNVYLVLGEWSRLDDVNTLIDAGADPAVIDFVHKAPTGVGKRKVDLVVLTHRHYDHTTMLPAIVQAFEPTVAAWGPETDGVNRSLTDGELLKLGDEEFEVIHSPGHTDDSVCLYGLRSHALFVGDTPVLVNGPGGSHEAGFAEAVRRMAGLDVRAIYFGHGDPLTEHCNERLALSVRNIEASMEKDSMA